jgi:hypothetical protein
MTISLVVNLVLGALLVTLGALCVADHRWVHWITRGLLKLAQRAYGEDFNVHPAVPGGVLIVLGTFALVVAFTIFAKWHDWWVVGGS